MNKKLLAVAVAGALALPGMALAQSSVTLSGVMKASIDSFKMGQNTGGGNNSEVRIKDDASRLVFRVTEDLGGGLSAIGHCDTRLHLDRGQAGLAAGLCNGPAWVGLKSKNWGEIAIGRWDLHYHHTSSDVAAKGALSAADTTILAGHMNGGAYGTIVGSSRWSNVVRYDAPRMGGMFDLILAYSTNISADDADIDSPVRKGGAWNIVPYLTGKNWRLLYSYAKNKPDGNLADQTGNRLMGYYNWGGLEVGLVWDKTEVRNATGTADAVDRTAWSIPVTYRTGPHTLAAHYAKAKDDKVQAGDQSAKMFAASYAYSLSKRTSLAVTYAKISNAAGARYRLYADHAYAGANNTPSAGEDPRTLSFTMLHTF